MRIPPFYELPSWQRFLAGVFIGIGVGWLLFLIIFGQLQEKQVQQIVKQSIKIRDLENRIEILNKDKKELNEKNSKLLTVQEIHVNFTNEKQLKLDSLTIHSLREDVKKELTDIVNQNINSVAENNSLLIRTVENKSYIIDNRTYNLEVNHLFIKTTTVELHLRILQMD